MNEGFIQLATHVAAALCAVFSGAGVMCEQRACRRSTTPHPVDLIPTARVGGNRAFGTILEVSWRSLALILAVIGDGHGPFTSAVRLPSEFRHRPGSRASTGEHRPIRYARADSGLRAESATRRLLSDSSTALSGHKMRHPLHTIAFIMLPHYVLIINHHFRRKRAS